MGRQLAKSTVERLRKKLKAEEARLEVIITEYERVFEDARLAETAAEHNADPNNADGGSLAFELEMDLSVQQNARELLKKVRHAIGRMERGVYGICEVTGDPIPVARLEALPYATTVVEWAHRA
jgi:RNA polymerase-binding protein DksA